MENLILVVFKNDVNAYNALSDLRMNNDQYEFNIIQAAVITKKRNQLYYKDGFNYDYEDVGFLTGGLIGGFIGIIGGPLGILIGSGLGFMAGGVLGTEKTLDGGAVLLDFANKIDNGDYALLLHVKEQVTEVIDNYLAQFNPEYILRKDSKEAYKELATVQAYENELFDSKHEEEIKEKVEKINQKVKDDTHEIHQKISSEKDKIEKEVKDKIKKA